MREEVEKIYRKFDVMERVVKVSRSEESEIVEAVAQLRFRFDQIVDVVALRADKLEHVQKSVNIINNMLVKPA